MPTSGEVTWTDALAITTFSGLALANIWFLATGRVRPASTVDAEKAELVRMYEARLVEKDKLVDRAMAGWEGASLAQERLAEAVKEAVARLDAAVRPRGRA